MFRPVSSRVSFPELDAHILQYWKDKDIFHRTETERPDAPLFTLFEGPPTANGSPGLHHVLARIFKDVICRYRTMKGYRCLRKGGWDTHGLPVELEIEEELGLSTKRDIEEYGIDKFNQKCRESVFRYVKEWETLTDRIGFWIDMEDPYITLDNEYIETGWWILKQLWDKGLLYQATRGTPHCPRCVTSLSSHEVALGYREDTPDPSVFIKFRAETWPGGDQPPVPTYLLAWTTTPWTLPGNTALAVDENAEYSVVELGQGGALERLVLATRLLQDTVHQDYTVVSTQRGADLVGIRYQPLYHPAEYGAEIRQFVRRETLGGGLAVELEPTTEFTLGVIGAGFVSMEDGTGIVHIAPGLRRRGSDSRARAGLGLRTARGICKESSPETIPSPENSSRTPIQTSWATFRSGACCTTRDIYRHTYPFCWRCDTPLLYYAKSSWYIPHHGGQGAVSQWQQHHQLVSGLYQGGPLRRVAAQQCGLGHLPGAVLGHAHSHLAMPVLSSYQSAWGASLN